MLSRVCWQTRKEHRLERIFCFLLEIDVLLHCWRCWQLSDISPFLPTPLFWPTGDLPNIRVHSVSAIFCAPYFLEVHSTTMQPQGSRVGLNIVPFNIHIMKRLEDTTPAAEVDAEC